MLPVVAVVPGSAQRGQGAEPGVPRGTQGPQPARPAQGAMLPLPEVDPTCESILPPPPNQLALRPG